MAPAAQDCGGSLSVHQVLCRWAPAYLEQFGAALPARQREVLQAILACRTPALGGALHYCPDCQHRHFSYHSCNDRHCPQCGGLDAQEWLLDNAALLLPVNYFLVTFTVPQGLRRWIRSHPARGYALLLAASAQALQDLAQNPKRLGATLGLLGVLHTWTRTLEYHPHVHYLVPGGGLSLDQRQWVRSPPQFLLPVKALSDRCRTLFRQALQKEMPEALADLPPQVWKQRWVVHSAAVGSGQNALRYLSRYVFKTATGNRQLQLLPSGKLRWPFRHSQTGAWCHVDLQPLEFIRRFLQHVLPAHFHRVRRFGWLHPSARVRLNRVRALLKTSPVLSAAEQAAWQPPLLDQPSAVPASAPTPAPLPCPRCGQPMVVAGRWRPGQDWHNLLCDSLPGVQRTTRPP
ncbi:MAG TPA: transposase [Candidatus Sulfotelmatobacter sp.]|nr:transposase [Candidatus Sulfotelmatobacter sp.]HWI56737.1 transposase [Bacillota bacterium]